MSPLAIEARASGYLAETEGPAAVERLGLLLSDAGLTGAEQVIYLWHGEADDPDGPCSLGWALACNFEDEEVVPLLLGLREVGSEYTIGGGAMPFLTVRRTR